MDEVQKNKKKTITNQRNECDPDHRCGIIIL